MEVVLENINPVFWERFNEAISKVGGNSKAAEIMEVSVKSVERWKAGAEPSLFALMALSTAIGVSFDWLIGQSDTEDSLISRKIFIDAAGATYNYLQKTNRDIDTFAFKILLNQVYDLAIKEGFIDDEKLYEAMRQKGL